MISLLEKYKNKIINGKEIADFIKFELQQKIEKEKLHKNLATILIGENQNSKTYTKLKKKFAEFINVGFSEYIIDKSEKEDSIIDSINFLNNDEEINGIIVQLPIPDKFNEDKILNSISKKKDVDGFLENTKFEPVIGKVILRILKEIDEINFENKKISIICNSDVFSNKIENYLCSKMRNIKIDKNIYNEKDLNKIKKSTKTADLIISIVGKKHFIKKDFVKEGAIIIDMGITKENDEIFGDADIKDIIEKVKYITPPTGGAGPMTVAMLFDNLING